MTEDRLEIRERKKLVKETVLAAAETAVEVVVETAPQDLQIDLGDMIRREREMMKHPIEKRQKTKKDLNYHSL